MKRMEKTTTTTTVATTTTYAQTHLCNIIYSYSTHSSIFLWLHSVSENHCIIVNNLQGRASPRRPISVVRLNWSYVQRRPQNVCHQWAVNLYNYVGAVITILKSISMRAIACRDIDVNVEVVLYTGWTNDWPFHVNLNCWYTHVWMMRVGWW